MQLCVHFVIFLTHKLLFLPLPAATTRRALPAGVTHRHHVRHVQQHRAHHPRLRKHDRYVRQYRVALVPGVVAGQRNGGGVRRPDARPRGAILPRSVVGVAKKKMRPHAHPHTVGRRWLPGCRPGGGPSRADGPPAADHRGDERSESEVDLKPDRIPPPQRKKNGANASPVDAVVPPLLRCACGGVTLAVAPSGGTRAGALEPPKHGLSGRHGRHGRRASASWSEKKTGQGSGDAGAFLGAQKKCVATFLNSVSAVRTFPVRSTGRSGTTSRLVERASTRET